MFNRKPERGRKQLTRLSYNMCHQRRRMKEQDFTLTRVYNTSVMADLKNTFQALRMPF